MGGSRSSRRRSTGLVAAAALLVFVLGLPAAASAKPARAGAGSGLLVTVAARECPTYQDIRANLARNNIMESLQDLGEDTLYTSGEPINPKMEREGQPNCKPITGWQFTLGSGIKERAVSGPWGSLSIVTGAEAPTVTTRASTPLLGWNGETIPGVALQGATTFELSQAQAERAGRNSLWIQGGTTTDPVLYSQPGFLGKYGFGALRCSIDNLNGDNVETIAFPAGTTHAFCYAYYVTPPPSSGTIVIRKEVVGSGTVSQSFRFGGNVSYNEGGRFDLAATEGSPGRETFYRAETKAGEDPWTVSEDVPDGWALTDIRCESAGSQVAVDRPKGEVSIRLKAGDTVTCTYVDTLKPPTGALLVRKVTEGGTGTFDFKVLDSGGSVAKVVHLTTKKEGEPAYTRPLLLSPGTYRVVEHSPHDRRGVWHAVSASCNGVAGKQAAATAVVTASQGALCTFTNRLQFPGRITIHKEALGKTGSALFHITALDDPSLRLNQVAVVKHERVPTLARGDSSRHLPFGHYVIQESVAQGTNPAGWSPVEVICNGRAVPFSQGRVVVKITESDPSVSCRFVNLFTPGPTPTPPGPPVEPGETADIAVTKTLISAGSGPTPTKVFRIGVKNLSGVTATNVVVTDEPGPGLVPIRAEPSSGQCVHTGQYACAFPSIPPHGEATVIVTAKDYGGGGTSNRAVAGSGSADGNKANNVSRVQVGKVPRHFPACRLNPAVAHASC
ncbi:MAG: DUF11 domain-containing protein [Actinobacteria bacterium]|nr:DUF11 domain-containing protein [Actinomycetota bacterium]